MSRISVARARKSSSKFSPVSALVSKNSMPFEEASCSRNNHQLTESILYNRDLFARVGHTALLWVSDDSGVVSRSILFPTRAILTSLLSVFCKWEDYMYGPHCYTEHVIVLVQLSAVTAVCS